MGKGTEHFLLNVWLGQVTTVSIGHTELVNV